MLVIVIGLAAVAVAQTPPSAAVSFTNVTGESGFVSLRDLGGHGIQVADIDGDGLLDVYVTHIFDPNKTGPTCCSETLVGVRSGSRKSDSSPASPTTGSFR